MYDLSILLSAMCFLFAGLSNNYPNRALLIYDGIHYDPLVSCDHHGNTVQSVFPVSNDTVLQVALEIATEANKVL